MTDQSFILVFLEPEKRLYKLTREGRVYEQRVVRRWRTFGPHRRRDLVPDYVDKVVTSAALARRVRETVQGRRFLERKADTCAQK